MRKTILKTLIMAAMTFAVNFAFAQEDAEGCKDHPLFSRIPGYYIDQCSENFNQFEIVTGVGKQQALEGTVSNYRYNIINEDSKRPSAFQIIKNYENAVLTKGGEKVYLASKPDNDGFTGATFKMNNNGSTYWLTLYEFNDIDACLGFQLTIVKMEAMKQDVTANAMFEKVNSGEPLTLYINFESGKSVIRNESLNIVDELYKMLNTNPSLKIIIEGHTDNTGTKAANQLLSEQRAASLKQALVKKGIAAERISTVGYGQDKPIAGNTTEEGRAKNRRVEIKKMQ
ncbi:MAG: OmpA family protein [Chitinophagaceae bacterium]|nr:OmpA family protein [Chitinophagaceae bacterium]